MARLTERHIPEHSLCLRREKVRGSKRRKFLLEGFPAWPNARIDVLPVVQAGPFHLTFTQGKSDGFNQMQNRAGGEACTTRVSGVPVNFGMHEYDVRCHCPNVSSCRGLGRRCQRFSDRQAGAFSDTTIE